MSQVCLLGYCIWFTYVASVLSGYCICFAMAFQVFAGFFATVFRHMLQIFHLDVSKVDQVLDMLQWRRWLADSGLPQGFGSYLARRASPSPLLSLPSLPFPSLHLVAAVRARRGNGGAQPGHTAPCVGRRHGQGESSRQRRFRAGEAHCTEQERETWARAFVPSSGR